MAGHVSNMLVLGVQRCHEFSTCLVLMADSSWALTWANVQEIFQECEQHGLQKFLLSAAQQTQQTCMFGYLPAVELIWATKTK